MLNLPPSWSLKLNPEAMSDPAPSNLID